LLDKDLTIPTGLIEIDLLNDSVFWSEETYQIFERPATLSPFNLEELYRIVAKKDAANLYRGFYHAILTDTSFDKIVRIYPVKEICKIVQTKGKVYVDNERQVKKLVVFIADITSLYKLNEKLADEKEKYLKLVEDASFGVGIEYGGIFSYANKTLVDFIGKEKTIPLAKSNLLEYLLPEDQKRISDFFDQTKGREIKSPLTIHFKVNSNNKGVRFLELQLTSIPIEKVLHTQALVYDITEKVEIEKSQRKLAADALYLNQKKMMLHEIRSELDRTLTAGDYHKADFEKIYELIDPYDKLDKDWDLMVTYFKAVSPDFFYRLSKQFPNLTVTDLKHCACIKMNFDTKESARFFNVKTTSIQIARVRLKKKMKLSRGMDLRFFIQNF